MKYRILLFILVLAVVLASSSSKPKNDAIYDFAIRDVQVFDSKNKTVLTNRTILINADTIAAVVPSTDPFNAVNTLNGEGNLVVPGFIDTHVHLNLIFEQANGYFPDSIPSDSSQYYRSILTDQFLKFGTTYLADMGQPENWLETSLQWQYQPMAEYPGLLNAGGAIISDEQRNPYMNHTEILGEQAGRGKYNFMPGKVSNT